MATVILSSLRLAYEAAFAHIRVYGHDGLLLDDDPSTRHMGVCCAECDERWRAATPKPGQTHEWPFALGASSTAKDRRQFVEKEYQYAYSKFKEDSERPRTAWSQLLEDD